jgi:hypothetical protein
MRQTGKIVVCAGVVLAVGLLPAGCKKTGSSGESAPQQSQVAGPEVTVSALRVQLNEVQSWPKDIICFTSASNPIKSLKETGGDAELAAEEKELIPYLQKLLALGGRPDNPIGLRPLVIGSPDSQFRANRKLRLLVARQGSAKAVVDGGGARIKFVEEQ